MPPRSKAEMLGLVERIVDMFTVQKMTSREIETELRFEGFKISKSSIQRTLTTFKEATELHQKDLEEARLLIEHVKNTPNTDIIEAAGSLASGRLLQFIKSIRELDFEDPMDFFEAYSRLANAQVNMGKLRMKYEEGYEQAKKDFLKDLSKTLKVEAPELLDTLRVIVNRMRAKK